jgi:hypothetical protein
MKYCRVNLSLFFMVVSIASSAEELVHFLQRPVEAVADFAGSRLGGRSLEVQDASELHCKKFSVRGWVYNNQAIFLIAPCHPGVTKLPFDFFSHIYDADSVLADATDLGETENAVECRRNACASSRQLIWYPTPGVEALISLLQQSLQRYIPLALSNSDHGSPSRTLSPISVNLESSL